VVLYDIATGAAMRKLPGYVRPLWFSKDGQRVELGEGFAVVSKLSKTVSCSSIIIWIISITTYVNPQ
jgi:hypothetical protein